MYVLSEFHYIKCRLNVNLFRRLNEILFTILWGERSYITIN